MGGAFIYSPQLTLCGEHVIGFGCEALVVREIPKARADHFVSEHHYAGSPVWSSNVHLGVFLGEDLAAALQFGPAMNPASGASVVADTRPDEWIELNRMVSVGETPDWFGSRAIAYAIRYLRRVRPALAWIQTFADERCGKLGALYQACSFLYCGTHTTTFYRLDGEWFHKSLLDRAEFDKRGWWSGPKAARLRAGKDRATAHDFRQFRYIKPLRKWVRRKLSLPVLPYPKPRDFGPQAP